jgi:hypothetical protein
MFTNLLPVVMMSFMEECPSGLNADEHSAGCKSNPGSARTSVFKIFGRVSEWFKETVLKTVVGESPP